ncbi:hypothetical protein Fmac_027622 [Flemingia macrophylla]|uniref:AMP-activated protein kinase glycogen-binding domain-containing protein n=1 Tax=Flemingia macrophylla TaxID=520843 RepID=A0ABD1LIG6_9FABA
MGSVWVCYFPSCTTLPCRHRECMLSPTHLLQPSTTLSLRTRASQSTTARTRTRRTRRVKSDAEICSDIREFLASVGLPEDHIPSTKELLLHGWNDLANIVRRRGHKQIQELLTRNSLHADFGDGLSAETSLDGVSAFENPLTGQNDKVDFLVNDVGGLAEFSSGSVYVDSSSSFDEGAFVIEEALVNSSVEDGLSEVKDHDEVVNDVTEGNFYPAEDIIADDDRDSSGEGLYPDFGGQSSIMPTEISGEEPFVTVSSGNSEGEDSTMGETVGEITLSLTESHSITSFNDSDINTGDKEISHLESLIEQKDLDALEGLDDGNDDIAEDVVATSEVTATTWENLSGGNGLDSSGHSADISSANLETLANLSLKEKVANFIQNGDLDPVEGTHSTEDTNVMAQGNSLTSEQVVPSEALNLDQPLWDDHLPHEDLTHYDKGKDTEAPKVQNQSEINHLKFMLYQKELELSRLKEQIEKEKLALSVLQTKAEEEISKARKLISEKDVELHVAEESLSGLKEVQIEFCGDGDDVEVAGSFNGWQHQIKMDPQPLTRDIDLGGSRTSKVWSAILWLYPGVYEIKFVVDGKWKTDPQRESVKRGHICNNILRVDR